MGILATIHWGHIIVVKISRLTNVPLFVIADYVDNHFSIQLVL
jgi:hypothetical protein